MFHSIRSVFSGALLSILLVSSVPSAEAFSFDGFSRMFAKMRGRDRVSVESQLSASGTVVFPARCKSYKEDDRERCEEIFEMRTASGKIMTHGEFTSAMKKDKERDEKDDNRSKKTVAEAEARVMKVLKHSIQTSFKAIRKACNQNNTEAALVTQCIASAKTRLQTGVSIMIDAAFTAN